MKNAEKAFLITGATAGIGKAAAIAIAKTGGRVILTSRDAKKGEQVVQEIINASQNRSIEMVLCDMASLQSVKECAAQCLKKYPKLEVLINNAGVFETERRVSQDGIEMTWAVNHLAPFLLTNLLLPALKQAEEARIITTSSIAHKFIKQINFDDVEFKTRFDGNKAYQQSKLANLLFSSHLAKLLKETAITSNALHPGVIATDLYRNFGPVKLFLFKIISALVGSPVISVEAGAETTIYLALDDEVKGVTGQYFHKKQRLPQSAAAQDLTMAEKLWRVSSDYVKNYL